MKLLSPILITAYAAGLLLLGTAMLLCAGVVRLARGLTEA